MKNFFLSSLNKTINAYLALDPESKNRFTALEGKTVTIKLLPLHFIFQFIFTEQGIRIQEADETTQADTQICGTPMQFMGMMINKEDRKRFFADDLTLSGNAELGQQVIALFDELEIDWEEYLSHLIGDAGAHQLSRVVSGVQQWLTNTQNILAQDINEYVHEEALWFPSREALQDFFSEIDTLRMDVDRAEAKIKRITALLTEDEGTQ